jgi:pimeloyl-ACP methyl ester carboxylesterase
MFPGQTQIVAVGHSLGGGLAQQAAFMDRGIRHVFAFDPSLLTGYDDPHVIGVRDRNVQGLAIERIYEHGEILAYPRFLLRQLVPAPACNPQVRTIRFNVVEGTLIARHKLNALTTALLNWSRTTPPAAKQTELPRPQPGDCPTGSGPALVAAAGGAR